MQEAEFMDESTSAPHAHMALKWDMHLTIVWFEVHIDMPNQDHLVALPPCRPVAVPMPVST